MTVLPQQQQQQQQQQQLLHQQSDASYVSGGETSSQYYHTDTDPDDAATGEEGGTASDSNAENRSNSNEDDFMDALEDVHTRFILNLPESELETAEKIFFQLEQAWWFYEDWICDPHPEKSHMPRFSHLKPFALKMFQYSPLLPNDKKKFHALWNEFSAYKRQISNYGCILLNADCSKLVLCRVWNGKSYTFPSGKINQGEVGVEAATRETYEETGFDPHCQQGKTRDMLASLGKVPWNYPLQEKDALSYQEAAGNNNNKGGNGPGKRRTCYVCCGVPEDFDFAPVCRKEVDKIEWFPLDQLPKPHYAVGPFMSQLKRWIKKHKKKNSSSSKKRQKARKERQTSKPRNGSSHKSRERNANSNNNNNQYNTPRRKRSGSGGNNTPGSSRQGSRQGSRQRVREQDTLVESGLAEAGDLSGWSEEDMFQANEKLLGRKIEYDGNPHNFADLSDQDPHAFHVVGGSFLNSKISSLAPPPQQSKLQPLFRSSDKSGAKDESDGADELQPFFSDEGATPWGHVISAAKGARTIPAAATTTPTNRKGASSGKKKGPSRKNNAAADGHGDDDDTGDDDAIITDAQVTRRSQATKARQMAVRNKHHAHKAPPLEQQAPPQQQEDDPVEQLKLLRAEQQAQYEADWAYVQKWVANLPKPKPTPHFGEFRLDADVILAKAGLVASGKS